MFLAKIFIGILLGLIARDFADDVNLLGVNVLINILKKMMVLLCIANGIREKENQMKLFKKKTKGQLTRICPYCGSIKIKKKRVMGFAPLNIWDNFICLKCKERWEKDSKKDKESKYLAKQIEKLEKE